MRPKPDRLLSMAERGRFLATLDTTPEEAYEGVLVDYDNAHLIFADVDQIGKTGDRLKFDGEMWIQRNRIKYMQNVPHRPMP